MMVIVGIELKTLTQTDELIIGKQRGGRPTEVKRIKRPLTTWLSFGVLLFYFEGLCKSSIVDIKTAALRRPADLSL